MIVKRTIKRGVAVIQGRRYRVPEWKAAEVEGQVVWVDDDGVCHHDVPRHGIKTDDTVCCYFPTKYRYFIYLQLDE